MPRTMVRGFEQKFERKTGRPYPRRGVQPVDVTIPWGATRGGILGAIAGIFDAILSWVRNRKDRRAFDVHGHSIRNELIRERPDTRSQIPVSAVNSAAIGTHRKAT